MGRFFEIVYIKILICGIKEEFQFKEFLTWQIYVINLRFIETFGS